MGSETEQGIKEVSFASILGLFWMGSETEQEGVTMSACSTQEEGRGGYCVCARLCVFCVCVCVMDFGITLCTDSLCNLDSCSKCIYIIYIVDMYTYMYVCMHACIKYVCMCVCMYLCMCMYIYVCMYVCMKVLCVYTHTHLQAYTTGMWPAPIYTHHRNTIFTHTILLLLHTHTHTQSLHAHTPTPPPPHLEAADADSFVGVFETAVLLLFPSQDSLVHHRPLNVCLCVYYQRYII